MLDISHLKTPKAVKVTPISEYRVEIVLEPFSPGFATTLMPPIRRILLASMPGFSIVHMNVEGMIDAYSVVSGVLEDGINLGLNLRGVRLNIHHASFADLTLSKKGPCTVTAADIQSISDIEILNPDHVIAHLTEASELNMTMYAMTGTGFVPADEIDLGEEEVLGGVRLDANFSPVIRAA